MLKMYPDQLATVIVADQFPLSAPSIFGLLSSKHCTVSYLSFIKKRFYLHLSPLLREYYSMVQIVTTFVST